MSRGPGWVQMACLWRIRKYEEGDDWPTTYDIAAAVYQVKPDADGDRWISDAQHVAVKRALEGLQRTGLIIGFRAQRARVPGSDHRTELCHHWMTGKRLAEWLAVQRKHAATAYRPEYFAKRADQIMRKAKAIGITLPSHKL
jgi:hypothetical protein